MSSYQIVFGKTCHLLRKFQLQELDELRLEEYENSRIYKQKFKKFHDQKILRKDFHGVVQLKDEHSSSTFHVNGYQIKPFHEGPAPITSDMEIISLMEPAPPDGNT
ncbi:hypothetical protein CR513_20601, partial [Mucuna pruriens]